MDVTVIDTATKDVVGDPIRLDLFADTFPTNVAVGTTSQGESRLFVTAFGLNAEGQLFGSVFVIDPVASSLVDCLQFGPGPSDSSCQKFGEMAGTLPAAVQIRNEDDRAFVSSFAVSLETTSIGLRASAVGGTLTTIDSTTAELRETMSAGNFPVSLDLTPESGAATVAEDRRRLETGFGTALPRGNGEECGAIFCGAPLVCIRDLGCHRNGCPPRDKCCPRDDLDCMACRQGSRDGAACGSSEECPEGQCVR
jgi:hypothetical protein